MHASVNMGCQGKSGPGKIHEVILVVFAVWLEAFLGVILDCMIDFYRYTIQAKLKLHSIMFVKNSTSALTLTVHLKYSTSELLDYTSEQTHLVSPLTNSFFLGSVVSLF